jgi:hypothetical protein
VPNPALEEIRARRAAEEDPFDQAAATRDLRRQARATGSREQAAYQAGQVEAAEREKATGAADPSAGGGSGAAPGGTPTRPPGRPSRASGAAPRASVIDNGAGFLLGLFGYALLINWIRGGPGQSWAWVKAKFVNQADTTSHTPAQSAANQSAIANQLQPPPAASLPSPSSGVGPGMYYPTGPLGQVVG